MSITTSDPALQVAVCSALGDTDRARVYALLDDVHRTTGQRPLNDHLWLDLVHGGRAGFAAVLCASGDDLVGYAQVSFGHDSWGLDVVAAPALDGVLRRRVVSLSLRAAVDEIARAGGGHVHWWVTDPDTDTHELASVVDLHRGRTLVQLRVGLPVSDGRPSADLATRPFRIDHDEAEWLVVNNAAFSWHPEQGGWDLATLQQREAEPWFDADGFLVHEREGRMAGFCWTKLHHDLDPVVGEIYVIAVHPEFHGLGLGRLLTVAGLDSIARRGVDVGMLYVDRDNTAAFELYRSLGFRTHRVEQAFVGDITATGDVAGAAPRSPVPEPDSSREEPHR
jgi:mycothiol synthase